MIMEAHDLIAALKAMALELGRTPRRREFTDSVVGGEYKIGKLFQGSYTALVQAAGLDSADKRVKPLKLRNEDFKIELTKHLEEYEPKELSPRTSWPKIAILGDMHEPFSHKECKAAFIKFCEETQPDYIIQVGDSVDFYSHSKFPTSKNFIQPKEEERLAKENLEKFWSELSRVCPKSKLIALLGNHCIRPLKRVLESVPSVEHWAEKYLRDYFTFPNVETVMDTRDEYKIADVIFTHGFFTRAGQTRDFFLENVVLGHVHKGTVNFRNFRGRTFFELNAGHCSDVQSKALSYTHTKSTGWTLGWGYIDKYGPRFIPFC